MLFREKPGKISEALRLNRELTEFGKQNGYLVDPDELATHVPRDSEAGLALVANLRKLPDKPTMSYVLKLVAESEHRSLQKKSIEPALNVEMLMEDLQGIERIYREEIVGALRDYAIAQQKDPSAVLAEFGLRTALAQRIGGSSPA